MSKVQSARLALVVLVFLMLAAPGISAQPESSPAAIHLRRATFDPLRSAPQTNSALRSDPASRLMIVQFEHTPGAETRQALEAAGLRPLAFIPTNAVLVRALGTQTPSLATVPDVRWSGPFQSGYKLAEDLDGELQTQTAGSFDLRIMVAPDADASTLVRAVESGGGHVFGQNAGVSGVSLLARVPAARLPALAGSDDVLWVERYVPPRALNDKARGVLGVTAARQQASWLTGNGQIVAVTDTGLDVQSNLSADFAGRVVQAFTPWQMGGGTQDCPNNSAAATWTDRNGHGTHVTGTILGSGALSGGQYAGIAPGARVVVQSVTTGNGVFDCFPTDNSFLSKAYAAGARIQNASWGTPPTDVNGNIKYGAYTDLERQIDDYLWQHKDYLFVVAAGNDGLDRDGNGVIDPSSIESPATAKNVLSVGASENNRPPTGSACVSFIYGRPQEDQCYGFYGGPPIVGDFISDDPAGMAAFSSRGPAADGRIKPEIVAPGTNVVSSASHDPSAMYTSGMVGGDYAYDNGTSMSTPMVSGLAALVRQWLAQSRGIAAPSAALVKALLMNGTTNIAPGQHGITSTLEIPAAWPNNVEGWGRAALSGAVDLGSGRQIWLSDSAVRLNRAGEGAVYFLNVDAGQPLRISLAWTDYPSFAGASRTLVNDLDLEVMPPSGEPLRGNGSAALSSDCRDQDGADRCDNVESVSIAAPKAGTYVVLVRGAAIVHGPQPFAVVARARSIAVGTPYSLLFPFFWVGAGSAAR